VAQSAVPAGWARADDLVQNSPEVDEALHAFTHDPTDDNAVGLVQAILNAAAPAPVAQGDHCRFPACQLTECPAKGCYEAPAINAVFETVDGGITGLKGATVKRVEKQDDGSVTVVIDHWPQPAPVAQHVRCIGRGDTGCGHVGGKSGDTCPNCGGMLLSCEAQIKALKTIANAPAPVAQIDALIAAMREVLEFQSAPTSPTIHDWGRWRRLVDGIKRAAPAPVAQPLTDEQIDALMPPADGSAEANVRRVEVLPGVMGTEFDEVDAWSLPLVRQVVLDALKLAGKDSSS
jgi:hypothetical protein